jgi:hypothetical protein
MKANRRVANRGFDISCLDYMAFSFLLLKESDPPSIHCINVPPVLSVSAAPPITNHTMAGTTIRSGPSRLRQPYFLVVVGRLVCARVEPNL